MIVITHAHDDHKVRCLTIINSPSPFKDLRPCLDQEWPHQYSDTGISFQINYWFSLGNRLSTFLLTRVSYNRGRPQNFFQGGAKSGSEVTKRQYWFLINKVTCPHLAWHFFAYCSNDIADKGRRLKYHVLYRRMKNEITSVRQFCPKSIAICFFILCQNYDVRQHAKNFAICSNDKPHFLISKEGQVRPCPYMRAPMVTILVAKNDHCRTASLAP